MIELTRGLYSFKEHTNVKINNFIAIHNMSVNSIYVRCRTAEVITVCFINHADSELPVRHTDKPRLLLYDGGSCHSSLGRVKRLSDFAYYTILVPVFGTHISSCRLFIVVMEKVPTKTRTWDELQTFELNFCESFFWWYTYFSNQYIYTSNTRRGTKLSVNSA